MVWSSFGQDGDVGGVFAQRFSSSGTVAGAELQVNTYATGVQHRARVAMEPDGGFVVVWESYHDGSASGVFARRFSSAGAALASEFQVNSYSTGNQYRPAVASESNGDFVVIWSSEQQEEVVRGIFGQRFSSAGDEIGGEFLVSPNPLNGTGASAVVAVDPDGDFVVAWQSFNGLGGEYDILAQRFSSSGATLGASFQVNSYTAGNQYTTQVAMGPAGDFVIVWGSELEDGSLNGLFGQRFSSSGSVQGAQFMVSTYTLGTQQSPTLVVDGDGDFTVAWEGVAFGSQYHIFARRFASTGAGVGSEFQVSSTAYPTYPAAAMEPGGDFVVAWDNNYGLPAASARDVFARRVAEIVADPLDVDDDGELQALTDGLLILRYLFGLRGAVLVAGVVDVASCARCTPEEIEVHLAVILPLLDVDGDGQVEALTDGLLILRYLFGLRAAVLIGGAVDLASCTRCLAAEIEAFVQGLAA